VTAHTRNPIKRIPQIAYIAGHYLLRGNQPFLASFKVSYRCNLRCLQCPFYSIENNELSYIEACTIIDRLYDRGNRLLMFEGGEPLLWRDADKRLHDLILYARRRFYSVGVTTNGMLPLDLPADVLWVSVDGLRETHNRLRGAPIFDQMIANVRTSRHPRLYAHVTINSLNAGEVPELLRFLNGIFNGITIQFYYPYHHKDDLFLDFDRRAPLLDEIIDLKAKGIRILNSKASLKALKYNTWVCRDRLIDNANPDGSFQQGCYLKGRTDIDCSRCGFSPHTEISLACQGQPQSILAGMKIFM